MRPTSPSFRGFAFILCLVTGFVLFSDFLYAKGGDDEGLTYAAPTEEGSASESSEFICPLPPGASSAPIFGTSTISSITINSWTPGAFAEGFVVYVNEANSGFVKPANGSSPAASTIWSGSGPQAVYNGVLPASPIVVTGLESGTTYYLTIYAYRDCPLAGGTLYESTAGLSTSAITAPNSAPSFSLPASPNRTVGNNAGAQTFSGFATDITDNDGGAQNLTFSISTNNDILFDVLPAIDGVSGDLTFTPSSTNTGIATVTVTLMDDGGDQGSGVDTSPTQQFDLFITPGDIVINEIDANDVGADDNEFIELFFESGALASSDNLTIVIFNGNDDLSFEAIDLDGLSFDADGFLLVGNPAVAGTVATFANGRLQNGVEAVALYMGDFSGNNVAPTLDALIDVIVYSSGQTDGTGLVSTFGGPVYREDGIGNGAIYSLARVGSIFTPRNPTPGAANSAPPTITIDDAVVDYLENSGQLRIDGAATANDADGDLDWNGGTLTVQITNNSEVNDELRITDGDGVAPNITVTDTDVFAGMNDIGDVNFTDGSAFGSDALIITFDDDATNEFVQETVQSIRFRHSSNNPSATDRTVTFRVTDATGESAEDTKVIRVIPQNDPPSVSGSNPLPSVLEVTEDTESTVDFSATGFRDPDFDVITLTLTVADGTFTRLADGTSFSVVATLEAGDTRARLVGIAGDINSFLNNPNRLRYTPPNNLSGPGATSIALVANDGQGSGDIDLGTVPVNIIAVNDDPTVTSLPTDISVTEDLESDIDLSAAVFEDIDDDNITVTLTVGAGTFSTPVDGDVLGVTEDLPIGTEVTLTGTADAINTYLDTPGNIRYTGADDVFGDNATTITVEINDNNGSGDLSFGTINIDVDPVNDDPEVANLPSAVTVLEDLASDLDFSSAVFADVDGDDITVTLSVVTGTFSTPVDGPGVVENLIGGTQITLAGAPADINAYLDVASNIQYTPPSNINGIGVTTIDVLANDGSSGDVDFGDVSVNITPVNDPPSLTVTTKNVLYAQGLGEVDLFDDADASTAEAGQSIAAFTITVSGVFDGALVGEDEVLTVDGTAISLEGGASGAMTSSLTYSSSLLANLATIDFSGTLTTGAFESIINSMTYANGSGNPTIDDRVITITSISDSGTGTLPDVNTTAINLSSTVMFVAKDNDSQITSAGGGTTVIDYTMAQGEEGALTTANTQQIMAFNVVDLGTNDPLPTVINQLTVDVVSGVLEDIKTISVFNGTDLLGSIGTIASDDNMIDLTTPISVANADAGTYSLNISFQDSVVDNVQYLLRIDDAAVASSGSSEVAAFSIQSPNGMSSNTLEVVRTGLFFVQLDTTVTLNRDFSVTIQAQDDLGSVDLDFNEQITLSLASGTGNLTSATSLSQFPGGSDGEVFFDDLQIDAAGNFTIRAVSNAFPTGTTSISMTATNGTSDIVADPGFAYPVNIDYRQYQAATFNARTDGLQVAQFIIRDGGASPDSDSNGTYLDSRQGGSDCNNSSGTCVDGADAFGIRVTQGNDNIRRLALYLLDASDIAGIPDNVLIGQYDATDEIYKFDVDDDNQNFRDAGSNNNDFIIADDGSATIGVFVTFKENVADNDPIVVEVTDVYHRTSLSGTSYSDFANDNGAPRGQLTNPVTLADPLLGQNLVEVTGTTLAFNPLPPTAPVQRETGFSLTLEAQDENGNLDLDESSALFLSISDDVLIESFTGVPTLVDGTVTLEDIVLDTANMVTDLMITVEDDDDVIGSQLGATSLSMATFDELDIDDTIDPTVGSLNPMDDQMSPAVDIDSDLVLTFSETVLPDIGNIVVVKNAVPPISDEIAASNSSQVTFSGNQVTITPTEVLDESSSYYVFIEEDAFKDPGGRNFAGFTTATDWNFDTETIVTLLAGTPIGSSGLRLVFNVDVEILNNDPAGFSLVDGVGTPLTITALTDNVLNNEELELEVDLSMAVGDLSLTYNAAAATDIANRANNLQKLVSTVVDIEVDLDQLAPELDFATANGTGQIDVTFTDAVQRNLPAATDFRVVDGLGDPYLVSSVEDGSPNDAILELLVADFGTAIGDLTLTYENSAGSVDDFGGNSLQDNTDGIVLDLDDEAPAMQSAATFSPTQLDITFSERVRLLEGDPPADFEVTDGLGSTYAVSALSDNTPEDLLIHLTVQSIAQAVGDIFISYSKSSTDIADFGGNSLASSMMDVSIDNDSESPSLQAAVDNNGSSSITLQFSEQVQIRTNEREDFIVTDALGDVYNVLSLSDAVGQDNELELLVRSYASAVGDLTITYLDDDDLGDIEDYGSNFLLDTPAGVEIDFDTEAPVIVSAVTNGFDEILVTFSEPVQIAMDGGEDFTVMDALGVPFVVSTTISDAVVEDNQLELSVANFAGAVGDLTLTYTRAASTIDDFGENTLLTDLAGVSVELDGDVPTILSVEEINVNTIDVTFSEAMRILDGAPSGDFRVVDGLGNSYSVSAISDDVVEDAKLRLTLQSLENSVGDIFVTYVRTATDLQDFGGNSLGTDTDAKVIDRDPDAPLLARVRPEGTTTIVLEFTEEVQLGNVEATSFAVTDGLGGVIGVNSVGDITEEDNELELLTTDFGLAVGDFEVTYNDDGDADRILDFGANFLGDGATATVDFDVDAPTITSAARSGFETIIVNFSEPVRITVDGGEDFTVSDALGTSFAVDMVIGDVAPEDDQLELSVANFAAAVGDLTVTYSKASSTIDDFGSNTLLTDLDGVSVELDGEAPLIVSAEEINETTIDITFNDAMRIVEGAPSGDFRVLDGLDNVYSVSAINDDVTEDMKLRLSVQSLENAIGDLFVTYERTATDLQDFGGNSLATDTDADVIDRDSDAPLLTGVRQEGTATIVLQFNELVQLGNVEPSSFAVIDGLGDPVAVNSVGDMTQEDNELELSTDDFAMAIGDLQVTYNDDGDADRILDFGANFLGDGATASLDFDTEDPVILSAIRSGFETIVVTFSEPVTIAMDGGSDFMVQDALGMTFSVGANIGDVLAEDDQLELAVADFAMAVGDLSLTYLRVASAIEDFGGNRLQDSSPIPVDLDIVPPVMVSVESPAPTVLDITFDDVVSVLNGAPASDFSVVDGAGDNFVVSTISDNLPNDDKIRLSVQSIAGAKGDIEIDYASNGSEIRDLGGNLFTAPPSALLFDRDATPPSLVSASVLNDTQIALTFDDAVQISDNQPTDFEVMDAQGMVFGAATLVDGTMTDNELVLTVADFAASVGDLQVTYTGADGLIEDFGGNPLDPDLVGVTIDRALTQSPVLFENMTGVSGDNDADVALYRTTGDPRTNQPIVITPNIDGSTIRIYSDENLTNIVQSEGPVSTATGYQPTLAELLPTIIWDDATDDHGVFSVYITEVAVGGASSEGPAVQYSVALLDDLSFSTATKTFRQSDNIGVTMTIDDHPSTDQDLLFSGNGLTSIVYNPGGSSSARFVPLAAGNGTQAIDITWENSATNVSATFEAVESFLVSEDVELFEMGQSRILCRTDGSTNLLVNEDPSNIDVDGAANDDNDQDFFGLEVYFIEDGQEKEDIPGDAPGVFKADGNIASLVLSYDPDNSVAPITPGVPSHTAGEWFFDPSAFAALGVSKYDIDTLKFAYIVSADDGSSLTFISEENILLFPDPTISITNLDNYYCESADPVRIRANVLAYEGGPDSTGFITSGYRLWYSPSDPTFATRQEYDFTSSGSLSNFWVPADPNQNGDSDEDESGYYRIFYESLPQGSPGCVGSTSVDLEVISLAPEPTISSDLSGIGGRRPSGSYLLEFCEGDPLPSIEASGIAVTWRSNNGATVIREGSTIDLLNDAFGGNNPQGGASVRLRIRNNNDLDNAGVRITDPDFRGCASNDVEVEVRIRAIPNAPEAVIADNGPASFNEEIIRSADGRSYLYEYCPGDDIAGIDLSPQNNTNNISDTRAHFLLIPQDSVVANAVSFDENFIDWSEDIFGGGAERDTTIYIALVTHDSVFAGGGPDAFAGCASEASTFELRISSEVVNDILTQLGDEFTTEYFTCFGDPITTIDIEEGTYNWYVDNGDLAYNRAEDGFINQAQDVTNNFLIGNITSYQASVGSAVTLNDYVVEEDPGIYYYWVRQIGNASEDSDFPGCESVPTLVSLTVFEAPLEPLFADMSVINENDDDVDFELFFCASDLDESVTFEASLNGFADGGFSTNATDDGTSANQVVHDFVWYNSNEFGDDGAFTASGAVVDAVDLGLISSNDVTSYIYMEQVTNIVNDQNGQQVFAGCASDGVVVQFSIKREPDAPQTSENAYYYCDGDDIEDLMLDGESNAFFTWMVEGSSVSFTNQADAFGLATASMDDLGIGQLPAADSIYSVKVVQRTDDQPGSTVPPLSDAFAGCTSDTTTVQIFVRSIPSAVSITTPLVCADGQLSEIRFSGDQQANAFYIYPTSDQLPSNRADTLGGNAEQISFDLLGAEAGRDTIIYVSQVTDTDINPDFIGCESPMTPIPVYAKPLLGDFGDNNGLINDPKACGDIVQLEVEITNQGADLFGDYQFVWSANNAVRNEATELSGSNPLLGGSVYSITMNQTFSGVSVPVSVTVTDTKNGCVAEASRNIPIGETPVPEFAVSKISAGNNTTFQFREQIVNNQNEIQNLTFEVVGGGVTVDLLERLRGPEIFDDYEVADGFEAGEYAATLLLVSTSGCEGSIERNFEILRREVVPVAGLSHDFDDADADGWISEGLNGFEDRVEIWEAAPPAASNEVINMDPNGERSAVWITNADGNYTSDEFHYFVYSPAFDFSALPFPAVSFDFFQDLVGVSDGVVFQWSTDDGETWANLGDYTTLDGTTGEGWFDLDGISGSPGVIETNPRQVGWAGSKAELEWQRAVHSLSVQALGDKTNVRFRFAMGVRPGDKSEGFAFDNFSIFNRDRLTILETFSSSISGDSRASNDSVYQSLQGSSLQNEIIWINYFTDLADDAAQRDQISAMNADDPQARLAFYGVSEIPAAALSGTVRTPREESIGELGFNTNDLLRSVLASTQFDVTVGASVEGEILNITANVTAKPENDLSFDEQSETSIRIAILQDEVSSEFVDNVNEPYTFRNRLIDILPSADGRVVTGDLVDGQVVFDETLEWQIGNLFGEANSEVGLTIVVFVQDEINKGVYQVGTVAARVTIPETVTGILPSFELAESYEIFPNPTDKRFTIQMDDPVTDDLRWSLADYAGREVLTGAFKKGTSETTVNIDELAAGVYLLKLFNTETSWQSRRVMVLRD